MFPAANDVNFVSITESRLVMFQIPLHFTIYILEALLKTELQLVSFVTPLLFRCLFDDVVVINLFQISLFVDLSILDALMNIELQEC